jgi:hypothetical protein
MKVASVARRNGGGERASPAGPRDRLSQSSSGLFSVVQPMTGARRQPS